MSRPRAIRDAAQFARVQDFLQEPPDDGPEEWEECEDCGGNGYTIVNGSGGSCQCFGEMPGHCPGPSNCPMCEREVSCQRCDGKTGYVGDYCVSESQWKREQQQEKTE